MNANLRRSSLMLRFTSVVTFIAAIITANCIGVMFPGIAAAQTVEDSAAVFTVVRAYQSTWNTRETVSLAEFFTKDADFVMGNLPAIQGRQAIRNWWQNYFTRQESGRRLTIVVNSIRRIASDAVLINVTTTTGGQDIQGAELLKRKARGTWLLHKQQGGWFISAMQGMPTDEDSVILKGSPETVKVLRPEIRVFVEAYENAFNKHDPDALSAFFKNDADIIVRNGPLIKGSRAIQEWWRDYFSRPRPYRALFIIDEIRIINPDVALLNIVATGAPQSTEVEQSSLRYARGRWLLVRESGNWFVAALRVLPGKDDSIIRKTY